MAGPGLRPPANDGVIVVDQPLGGDARHAPVPYLEGWLTRLRPGARPAYRATVLAFARHLRAGPDGLVRRAQRDYGYPMLHQVQRYVLTRGSRADRQWTYAALRSFFAHSRVELPRDARFMLQVNAGPGDVC